MQKQIIRKDLNHLWIIVYHKKRENKKRYLPHDLKKTKEKAVKTYMNNGDIEYTCRKYHISRISLWRWMKKYDGTKESLEDKKS